MLYFVMTHARASFRPARGRHEIITILRWWNIDVTSKHRMRWEPIFDERAPHRQVNQHSWSSTRICKASIAVGMLYRAIAREPLHHAAFVFGAGGDTSFIMPWRSRRDIYFCGGIGLIYIRPLRLYSSVWYQFWVLVARRWSKYRNAKYALKRDQQPKDLRCCVSVFWSYDVDH